MHVFDELLESEAFGTFAEPNLLPGSKRECYNFKLGDVRYNFQGEANKKTDNRIVRRNIISYFHLSCKLRRYFMSSKPWEENFEPLKIFGNLYFVGAARIGAYR